LAIKRKWLIALLVGIVVGAGGMYGGLSLADRIHSFPQFEYFRDDLNQPIRHVYGHLRAQELSKSPRGGWENDAMVDLPDGRKLVAELADMHVMPAQDVLFVSISLQQRFLNDDYPSPEASAAWKALPKATKTSARQDICRSIASTVAGKMRMDPADVLVCVPAAKMTWQQK
jgi:hypothetical protein